MRESKISPNWAELVHNFAEIATNVNFDIAKTWFEGTEDPSEISLSDVPLVFQEYTTIAGNKGAI